MSSPVQIGTEVLFCELLVLGGVLPGDHVLEPGRIVLLDPLRETDAVLQRDVTEMVDGERDLRADHFADLGDVLLQEVEALLGEMQAGEGVADVVHVIAGIAPPPVVQRLDGDPLGVGPVSVEHAGRRADGARHVHDLREAEVHLEEGVAERHALLQALAGLGAARLARVGVAIHAHAVAEFSAEHLVDRNPIGLAGEVPERDLDRRDAAALAAVAAELLDPPEQPVDVAGVLAEQPALQHQGEGGAGAVAHLAEADDSLVGVDFQERGRERRADDLGDPHVGDPKLGRFRIRVDPVEGFFRRVLVHRGVLILVTWWSSSGERREIRGPAPASPGCSGLRFAPPENDSS